VTDWLNNVTSYEYDQAGNLITVNLPDGSTVLYDYDIANRLTSIVDFTADGTITGAFRYSFDALGNRTPISSYQPLTAIPKPQNPSYTYDAENSLLTAGNMTFSYDNNGNMTQKTVGSSLTTFTWDFDNMLTELSSGNRIFDFSYDGVGSRIAKMEGSAEKRYVVDGGTVLAETDTSGTITAYYVYGLGLISKITPDDHAYYYHYDGLGSTIAITDSTGAIVNKYAYDDFGKILKSGETIQNPFKYVGAYGVMDDGNGLYYMRARYYDPRIGRFVSKDPIGLMGGINGYSCVEDNPISRVDPLGLEYMDLNFSFGFSSGIGVTGGLISSPAGLQFYAGGGIMTPGFSFSLTGSPSDPTPGWYEAIQINLGLAYQKGRELRKGGKPFWELGGGWGAPSPVGYSATLFHVFKPVSGWPSGEGSQKPCRK
jgi:RHS repeat-associated protein